MRAKRIFQRTQRQNQRGDLRRGEWNVFLFAALCALLVLSPAASAPLFANAPLLTNAPLVASVAAKPSDYQAVLWWLRAVQSSSGDEARFSQGALSLLDSLSQREIASLVCAVEAQLTAPLTAPLTAQLDASCQTQPSNSPHVAMCDASLAWLDSSLRVPRRTLVLHRNSLTPHEAALLSGVRALHPRE